MLSENDLLVMHSSNAFSGIKATYNETLAHLKVYRLNPLAIVLECVCDPLTEPGHGEHANQVISIED